MNCEKDIMCVHNDVQKVIESLPNNENLCNEVCFVSMAKKRWQQIKYGSLTVQQIVICQFFCAPCSGSNSQFLMIILLA